MNKQIFILCGKKGSGKDTLGDYISNKYGYIKMSFADPLKETTIKLIKLFYNVNISRKLLDSRGKDYMGFSIENNDKLKRTIDRLTPGMYDNNVTKITYRNMLQYIGTEIFRDMYSNIFPFLMCNKIDNIIKMTSTNIKIVITDCRFQNEIDYIKKKYNCVSILVTRKYKDTKDCHVSENQELKCDHNLSNDSHKNDLYDKFEILFGNKKINNSVII